MPVAEKTTKDLNAEITILQNTLEDLKSEVDVLQKRKQLLNDEVAKKANDAQIWLDGQRKMFEKEQGTFAEERTKIAEAKKELEIMLREATGVRDAAQKEKTFIEEEKSRLQSVRNRYDHFSLAVKRAYDLI